MTVLFEKVRETKNTVRFEEKPAEDEAPVIGTLYVQKHFAKGSTTLKVTIEKVD